MTTSTSSTLSEHQDDHAEEHRLEWAEIARIVFVALACGAVWFRVWEPFEKVSVIGLVAALIGMFPILEEAFEAILERRMTMELSMTIAIGDPATVFTPDRVDELSAAIRGVNFAATAFGVEHAWEDRISRYVANDVSATNIRRRAQKGQSIHGLVSVRVEEYILKQGLYR